MNIVRAASAARLEDRVFILSVVISGVMQVVSNEIGPWVLHDRFRHFALWLTSIAFVAFGVSISCRFVGWHCGFINCFGDTGTKGNCCFVW